MIPILYDQAETEFTSNGLGRLSDAITCSVTEQRNGLYELSMIYPITGIHFSDIGIDRIIFAVPADGKDPQPFRIYRISSPMSGQIVIAAEHISYMLSRIPAMPFKAESCADALRGFKLNSAGDCPFDFFTDKEIATAYSQTEPASIRSRLGGVEGSILDLYKGEFEFDKWTVKLWKNRGADKGVTIRYGKNITSLTQEENIQETITGIVPYWQKENEDGTTTLVTLDEKTVYAENASSYPYERTAVVDFSDKMEEEPSQDDLRQLAERYIISNKIGIPEVTLDVSFVSLWQTEQYKDISSLERVNLCDTITVIFPELNVKAKAEVVSTTFDVLLEKYTEITIGDQPVSLADTIADTSSTVKQAVKESTSAFEAGIAHATAQITGALGGNVVIGRNADGHPNEILIMDTPNTETAVNVIRINEGGIGFSQSGYNGPFTSAWTINGTFDASQINVVNLSGQQITTGEISDRQRKNYWNLDSGIFELNATAGSINGSPIETSDTTSDLREGLAVLQQHLRWDPDRGLSITTNEGMEVLLTATKMSFLQNGTEVAYISNQELYITDARILSSITIGEFKFLPRQNGNLSFVYVGGET